MMRLSLARRERERASERASKQSLQQQRRCALRLMMAARPDLSHHHSFIVWLFSFQGTQAKLTLSSQPTAPPNRWDLLNLRMYNVHTTLHGRIHGGGQIVSAWYMAYDSAIRPDIILLTNPCAIYAKINMNCALFCGCGCCIRGTMLMALTNQWNLSMLQSCPDNGRFSDFVVDHLLLLCHCRRRSRLLLLCRRRCRIWHQYALYILHYLRQS